MQKFSFTIVSSDDIPDQARLVIENRESDELRLSRLYHLEDFASYISRNEKCDIVVDHQDRDQHEHEGKKFKSNVLKDFNEQLKQAIQAADEEGESRLRYREVIEILTFLLSRSDLINVNSFDVKRAVAFCRIEDPTYLSFSSVLNVISDELRTVSCARHMDIDQQSDDFSLQLQKLFCAELRSTANHITNCFEDIRQKKETISISRKDANNILKEK